MVQFPWNVEVFPVACATFVTSRSVLVITHSKVSLLLVIRWGCPCALVLTSPLGGNCERVLPDCSHAGVDSPHIRCKRWPLISTDDMCFVEGKIFN